LRQLVSCRPSVQTSKHTHLFKGELWVMYVQKVLVSCSSSKASRVLATKPIQRLQNTCKTLWRECPLMPRPCCVAVAVAVC